MQKEDSTETKIQAILFADSFQTKFLPLSTEVPKVLMPIANTPMIDFTIKFLRDNRIKDIIVYTSNNRNKIKEYFRKVPLLEGCNVKVFSTEERTSVGQALRDIHSQENLITCEDILLIFGDVLAHFDLSKVIAEYTKKKRDRSIMTKIFKRVPLNSPLRTQDDDCVVILDNNTSQILQYKPIPNSKEIDFNLEKINFNKCRNNIGIHYDWVDTEITLCTKEIFHLLNEHFYDDFRDDLVNDVLNSEIIEDKVHAYLLDESDFVGKVIDFRTYGILNQYITSRWLYPVVPSTHDLRLKDRTEKNTLRYSDLNLYLGDQVQVAYSAKLSNNSVVGTASSIDEGAVIERSTIGRNCKIGKNVKIRESIIWNNVVINDDCVLDRCLVADNCIIRKDSKIHQGSILSLGVETKESANIPSNSLITLSKGADQEYLIKGKLFGDKDFELQSDEYLGVKSEYYKQVLEYPEHSDGSEEVEDDFGFKEEVQNLLESSIKDNVKVENIAIELESSRLRCTATFSDCITYGLPIILKQIEVGDGAANTILKNMKTVIDTWKQLFKSIVKSENDQAVFLEEIETFCRDTEAFRGAFHLFLQLLFQAEILEQDVIVGWGKENENSTDEIIQKFYKASEPFLKYLDQDDEEEEEEEEEGEEDEEDN